MEAKALGGNLNDRRWANQIMGHAAVAGVEWVVLTNGDEYRIYNAHATVPVEDKVFRTIRVTDEQSRPDATLGVLSKEHMKDNWIDVLWKTQFVDRQIRAALEALFGPEPDQALVRVLSRRLPTLSHGDIKAGLGRLGVRLDFPEGTDIGPPKPSPQPSREKEERPEKDREETATPWRNVSVQDLIASGLIRLPLDLERTYKGRRVTARWKLMAA